MAEAFPDGQWAWCYTQDRLQVRAVEVALATTANIESRRAQMGDARVNEILALRAGWNVLLESLGKQAVATERKRQRWNQTRRKRANGTTNP